MIEQLHFLRPLWLLAILPAVLLIIFWWRTQGSDASWRRAVAPELLTYLLDTRHERRQRWPWFLVGLGWLLACVALAGPTWEKLPQPVLQSRDALVIVLDLSLSMTAEDIQPSRLQRARYKILDALAKRQEGLTGLVVYAGDAHIVTPLTDDTATIENMVPALAPDMMPLYGSNVREGIEQALALLNNGGVQHGRILLITDGIESADIDAIASQLHETPHDLSILGVGTEQGAPIPMNGGPGTGGFLKQRDGTIAIPQLHGELLQQLANKCQGNYRALTVDDSDLNTLLPATLPDDNALRVTEREFDQWRERGPWLVLVLLPLAALAFRRGWLLIIFAMALLFPDAHGFAADHSAATEQTPTQDNWINQGQQLWRNLWSTPDQQAMQALGNGDAKTAAQQFSDPAWRASAHYRAGNYEQAAQAFQTLRGADGSTPADADYNRGNALARAGQLEAALKAYSEALQKNPALADAKANRKLVEQLLKQQQATEPDSKSGDQNNSPSNQHDTDQNTSQSAQSRDSQDKQNADQKNNSASSQQADAPPSGANRTPDKSRTGQQTEQQAEQQAQQNSKSAQADEKQTGQARTASEQKPSPDQPESQQQATSAPETAVDPKAKSTGARQQPLTPEQQRQQQVMEQWLRQIPDDPSGLLRRKFDYEHRQRMRDDAPASDGPIW